MNHSPAQSFVNRLRSRHIYLIRGKDITGRQAWYYLRVCRRPPALFEKAVRQGSIQLTDYGEILFSGYGQDPPETIVKTMSEQWGFQE